MENPVLKKGIFGGDGNYTLRDKFAGQAMQSIELKVHDASFESVAEQAYKLADAMLKERLK